MIASFLLVVLVSLFVIYELKIVNNKNIRSINIFLLLFTIVHFGIAACYSILLDKLTSIHDPVDFYNTALHSKHWLSVFGLGSKFMSFIIYPLVKLKCSIFALFLLFSAISFKGFLIVFDLLNLDKLEKKQYWLLLFFLLPSIHFWTGSLGKEAILIYCMAIILSKVKSWELDFQLVIILLITFLVRPHLFLILIFAFGLLFILDSQISLKLRLRVGIATLSAICVGVFVFLFYFLQIESLDSSSIMSYSNFFLNFTQNIGDSKIDLVDTNVFSRILYLVFMPLPFLYDIKNQLQLGVAMENVLFLFLFIIAVITILRKKQGCNEVGMDVKFAFISTLLIIVLFGSYLYNLGLGNRMRVMFLPYLIFTIISLQTTKADNVKLVHK